MSNKQPYVVGFLFDPELYWVVLIKKNRPGWQAGKLNGVGGHVEEGEDPLTAMQREFREETGVDIPDWRRFCRLDFVNGVLDCYFSVSEKYKNVTTCTDEEVTWYEISGLMENGGYCVPNVKWLTQMALSLMAGEVADGFLISEVSHNVWD
jgi:8-oxo-dGTP diphosphatase